MPSSRLVRSASASGSPGTTTRSFITPSRTGAVRSAANIVSISPVNSSGSRKASILQAMNMCPMPGNGPSEKDGAISKLQGLPESGPQSTSTITDNPNPLWPDVVRSPPRGVSPPTRNGSVVGCPVASTAQPAGIGNPALRAISIFPHATVLVDMSSTSGRQEPVGTAKARGLVPSIGSRANVGTTRREALVIDIPPRPRAAAIAA